MSMDTGTMDQTEKVGVRAADQKAFSIRKIMICSVRRRLSSQDASIGFCVLNYCINTDVLWDSNKKIRCNVLLDPAQNKNQYLYAAGGNGQTGAMFLAVLNGVTSWKNRIITSGVRGNWLASNYIITPSAVCLIEHTYNELLVDGVKIASPATGSGNKLFIGNYDISVCFSYCAFSFFEIYDGDTLIRNYIPKYDSSTNSRGLYETVNGNYYPQEYL